MKENVKIREEMKTRGVPQWMVAAQLHVSESTLIRWLRMPLNKDREEDVLQAIMAVAQAKEANYHV